MSCAKRFRVGARCGAQAPTRKMLRIFRPPHKGEVSLQFESSSPSFCGCWPGGGGGGGGGGLRPKSQSKKLPPRSCCGPDGCCSRSAFGAPPRLEFVVAGGGRLGGGRGVEEGIVDGGLRRGFVERRGFHAVLGRDHHLAPDLRRQRAAGDALHRRGVVVADPHARHIVGGEADEPGVVIVLRRAGLARRLVTGDARRCVPCRSSPRRRASRPGPCRHARR